MLLLSLPDELLAHTLQTLYGPIAAQALERVVCYLSSADEVRSARSTKALARGRAWNGRVTAHAYNNGRTRDLVRSVAWTRHCKHDCKVVSG